MRADRFFLALLVVFLGILPFGGVRASEHLTILHVNDFHGRMFPYVDKTIEPSKPASGAAYLAGQIERERARNPEGTILLSAGDMFQGTPVSNLFRGRPVLDVMNRLCFDAMTLGNHEFDWGMESLGDIVGSARFPVLCANIVGGDGLPISGVEPYIMIRRKGINVAVIGVTTPEILYMVNSKQLTHLNVLDPKRVVPDLIRKAREAGAHITVLLSHIGLEEDRKLAARTQGIDVIVGGHSHTVVKDPLVVGKTVIVQAGYYGLYLGVLDLTVDEKTGRIIEVTTKDELKLVSAGPGDAFDADIARIADGYGDRIKERFQTVVGKTGIDLTRQGETDSIMGDTITDAIRASTGADVAFHNSGGIRADIPAGDITMEQVFTVLPFDNVVVTMDLKGADILDILEKSTGANKGMLQVSGLRVEYDLSTSAGRKVAAVQIGGKPLKKDGTYRVSTNDFLAAGGDRFSPFGRGRNIVYGGDLREFSSNTSRPIRPSPCRAGDGSSCGRDEREAYRIRQRQAGRGLPRDEGAPCPHCRR